jgi:hypothetical protein
MAPIQSMNHTAPSSAREERAALDEALKKIETRPSGVHGLGTFTKCALSEGQVSRHQAETPHDSSDVIDL